MGIFAIMVGGLIAIVAALYLSGMVTVLGYAKDHQKSKFFVREHFSGFSWGLRTLWLEKDWKIYVDYEVNAKAGSLSLSLMETFAPIDRRAPEVQTICGQDSGRLSLQAPHSGFFTLYYFCSPLHGPANHQGDFIDVDYRLTWGLHTQSTKGDFDRLKFSPLKSR